MKQHPTGLLSTLALSVLALTVPCAGGADLSSDARASQETSSSQFPPREFLDDPPVSKAELKRTQLTAPASTWTRGDFTSVQVNVNAQGHNIFGDAANEPSIALDPTNPNRLVIGWRQFDTVGSNFRQAGWAYSHDSGLNWTFPGVLEPNEFSSDPVLDFDAEGRIYYYALQPERVLDEWFCYMYRSDDGGVTWLEENFAWGGDKAWVAIDRTNGVGRGNIYAVWSVNAGCCDDNIFTRSVDWGASFSYPVPIENSPRFGTITVARDGAVYVVGGVGTSGSIYVAKSLDAQNGGLAPTFGQVVEVDLGGNVAFSTGPNPAGLLGQTWIATDHSDGVMGGNVYVLGSVDPPGSDPLEVMFVRSTDGGLTWSAPVRVNDDPVGTNAWQWFGTMSVAPNGRIDAIWNDTRADPWDYSSELHYSYSLDGGVSWSPNEPASPPFDPHLGWPNQNKIGDYYDMLSDNFGANLAYAATFNGEQDVYYLRIGETDCNENGIPDSQDVIGGNSDDCNNNVVPDECERDCNDSGVEDSCDVAQGTSEDCDGNLNPDECDPDFDGDGVIDECDWDDDNDGVADYRDDCPFTPEGVPVGSNGAPLGDTNGNCVLDAPDIVRLIPCMTNGGPDVDTGRVCLLLYDYGADGDTDLEDFAAFQAAFGRE